MITCAEVGQEQRTIRAEEALRNTRWRNASTAERLQEEFRRLSVHMVSTFDSNEKLAMKALADLNVLRLEKLDLEESLYSIKDCYEAKLFELCEHPIQLSTFSDCSAHSHSM